MCQEHRGSKQIKSICDLHTTECNVTLYMFVCLWRESTVRKGSVQLAAWHLWTECSGQWHGLGGPNRTVLSTTNSPVQESMSNVGVLKLLSLLYCLFCIFDSLKTLTECVCVCVYGAYLFVPENPNIIMSTSIQYAARIWKKLAKISSSAVLL